MNTPHALAAETHLGSGCALPVNCCYVKLMGQEHGGGDKFTCLIHMEDASPSRRTGPSPDEGLGRTLSSLFSILGILWFFIVTCVTGTTNRSELASQGAGGEDRQELARREAWLCLEPTE